MWFSCLNINPKKGSGVHLGSQIPIYSHQPAKIKDFQLAHRLYLGNLPWWEPHNMCKNSKANGQSLKLRPSNLPAQRMTNPCAHSHSYILKNMQKRKHGSCRLLLCFFIQISRFLTPFSSLQPLSIYKAMVSIRQIQILCGDEPSMTNTYPKSNSIMYRYLLILF